MANIFSPPYQTTLDANGNPISGARLFFYVTGTLTPATVYSNAAQTTPLTQPVIADSAGRYVAIYLDPAITYRCRVCDAAGSIIRDVDPCANSFDSASLDAIEADVSALDIRVDALENGSALLSVTSQTVPGSFPLPTSFNDQIGGTQAIYDGNDWRFDQSRWSALDKRPANTFTNYYLNYARPNDAGDGLSSGAAKKTWKALTDVIKALAAGSNVQINIEQQYIGYLSTATTAADWADGKNVVIECVHASKEAIYVNMREDKDQASFAFVAHGTNGAWKCPIANAGAWVANFDLTTLDEDGFGVPCVSTGMSAALVDTTECTAFADATWFYIHLRGGAKPNPFVNWLYCNNVGNGDVTHRISSGSFLANGLGAFLGAAGVSTAGLYFVCVSDAAPNTTSRIALKNGRAFGCSGNGVGTEAMRVVATEKMKSAYQFNDGFNYHKRIGVVASNGTLLTTYEDRCFARDCGYSGFAWGLTASNSDNGSSEHDGGSIARAGSRYVNIKDAPMVDVGGADSANFGVKCSRNGTGSGSYYPGSFVYEANTGEGLRRRMVLVGCGSDNGTGTYAIMNYGSATDAVIHVQAWAGPSTAAVFKGVGSIKNYETGVALA